LSVNADGSGEYPTIQSAIDAATDGDVVQLSSGTYLGEGNRDIRFLGKALTVRSASRSPRDCTINCEGSSGEPHRGFHFFLGEGTGSVVEGLTITGGYHTSGAGIFCIDSSSPTITDCIFENNQASLYGGGLYTSMNASPTITGTLFIGNRADFFGGAVFCNSDSPADFSGCTFAGNESDNGGGLFYKDCLASIDHCTINGNSATYGSGIYIGTGGSISINATLIAFGLLGEAVYCDGNGEVTLADCDLYNNAGGDWVDDIEDQLETNNNLSVDPLFCEEDPNGLASWLLMAGSPCSAELHEGVTIGAWDVGCGLEPTQRTSWGTIKEMYRAKP